MPRAFPFPLHDCLRFLHAFVARVKFRDFPFITGREWVKNRGMNKNYWSCPLNLHEFPSVPQFFIWIVNPMQQTQVGISFSNNHLGECAPPHVWAVNDFDPKWWRSCIDQILYLFVDTSLLIELTKLYRDPGLICSVKALCLMCHAAFARSIGRV